MRFLIPLSLVLLLLVSCNGSPTEPHIDATSTLTGRVVYAETGAPAEGARIVANQSFPGHSHGEAFVNADGRYHVTGIAGGGTSISVYAPGAAINDPSFSRNIHLAPGPSVLDVQISANRCVTITGRVLESRSPWVPIAGANLQLGDQPTVSGGDGSYSFALGCPPPDVNKARLLTIQHPRYHPRELQSSVPSYSTVRDIPLDPL